MSRAKKELDLREDHSKYEWVNYTTQSDDETLNGLLLKFKEKDKPSENILVVIQHIEAIQRLLIKEVNEIDVVDSEIVK